MAFQFQKFLFSQLPLYFKLNDTYKDNNDRGLLERYLEIFGLEIDQEIKPKIDEYLEIINPLETDVKFLTTLGYTLGSPPHFIGDDAQYAKLLAYIMSIYKIKGTAKSYELLFALLGYTISIVEVPPSEATLFDDSNIFDDTPSETVDTGCPPCSDYEVIVKTLLTTSGEGSCIAPINSSIDNTILPVFIKIIEFNQPINAHFTGIVNGADLCEDVKYCIGSKVTLNTYFTTSLDQLLILDDSNNMDFQTVIQTSITNEDCEGNPLPISGIGFSEIESDFEVA